MVELLYTYSLPYFRKLSELTREIRNLLDRISKRLIDTAPEFADPEVTRYEAEKTLQLLINEKFDLENGIAIVLKPYLVRPTAAQDEVERQTWLADNSFGAEFKDMGSLIAPYARFGEAPLELENPWAFRLKNSPHGWKYEDGLPVPFFSRVLHHADAWLLTSGHDMCLIKSLQKHLGERIQVFIERPDRASKTPDDNGALVFVYINIKQRSENRKDYILRDMSFILAFLTNYKQYLATVSTGQECMNIVDFWVCFRKSRIRFQYPTEAAFKFPPETLKRYKDERSAARKATQKPTVSALSLNIPTVAAPAPIPEPVHVSAILRRQLLAAKKKEDAAAAKKAEDAAAKEQAAAAAKKAEDAAAKKQAAAAAKKAEDAAAKKQAAAAAATDKAVAIAAEVDTDEHPLLKSLPERPAYFHGKTLAWIQTTYSEELSVEDLLKVLERHLGIKPKRMT